MVYGRPRTFIALAVGVIAFWLLPGTLRLPTRLVVGWDVFTALYLVLAYIVMLRCDIGHTASAVKQDDGRFLLLLLTALGAFASLAAIVLELGASRATRQGRYSPWDDAVSWAISIPPLARSTNDHRKMPRTQVQYPQRHTAGVQTQNRENNPMQSRMARSRLGSTSGRLRPGHGMVRRAHGPT